MSKIKNWGTNPYIYSPLIPINWPYLLLRRALFAPGGGRVEGREAKWGNLTALKGYAMETESLAAKLLAERSRRREADR